MSDRDLFWAMVAVVILWPAFCLWVRHQRQTEGPRDAWRRVDRLQRQWDPNRRRDDKMERP